MAGLFQLKPRSSKEADSSIVTRAKTRAKQTAITVKGGSSISQRIATAKALVEKYLGKYTEEYLCIRDEQTLVEYIDTVIADGAVAIDTETTSLEPITTTLAGISLYSPSNKAAYIPINHLSAVTGDRVSNQIDSEFIRTQMIRIIDAKVKTVMFNAKFDMRVLRHQLNLVDEDGGYLLVADYCGSLAGKTLNENERENGLKALWKKYVLGDASDAFSFDDLFKGIPFTHIPIKTGYLYAAHDAKITYDLFLYQSPFLDRDNTECTSRELQGIAGVFHDIEMPIVKVVCEMEDAGITLDFEYQQSLSVKYHKLLEERKATFHRICESFEKATADFRRDNPGVKLDTPINIASPNQIAILLYDILKLQGSKKSPRSTEEKYIKSIDHPIVAALLDCREVEKLLSTYIDKMPNIVNIFTKKIHCSFWQYGAVTGRFSSSEPNMQNIPSHNTDIRKMFRASKGNVLLLSDYSGQEPRITAHMSKDEKMIQAFVDGKDIYCEIASIAFGVPYEDCLEERADGSKNPEGKARRQKAKAIVLGICYGKQINSIAEDLKTSVQAAQEIYDKVMIAFPGLYNFMVDSQDMARELGYVETAFGRKRRLPDMQREKYEFSWLNGVSNDFDPMFDDEEEEFEISPVPDSTKQKYITMLSKTFSWKAKQGILDAAKAENIKIVDNTGFINDAERQCVNSRIQGSAADLTKKAMYLVGTNKRLKELGFRLLLQVHDELIGECPYENRKEAAKLLSDLMIEAAKDLIVPMKCDVDMTECWYGEKVA